MAPNIVSMFDSFSPLVQSHPLLKKNFIATAGIHSFMERVLHHVRLE